MFEIASSKLALQRSQMPATRSYAEHMIADHSATSSRLSGIVAGSSLTVPTSMDSTHEQMMARLTNAGSGEFDAAYVMAQQSVHKWAVEMLTAHAASGTELA
jgi:putative membrane protein